MSVARAGATSPVAVARLRILVIVQGDLGDRPQGPEIRGLQIARGFARRHDVTVAASTDKPFLHDGMSVVPRSRRSLWREMRRQDVIVGPVLPPHLLSLLTQRRCLRVSDLYDPVDLEMDTLSDNGRVVGQQRRLRRLQLRWSDVVVSANDRQCDRARTDLKAVARPGAGPLLLKVGMGLPEPPESVVDRPLRKRFGIAEDDPVVLWWGTAWRWLDAEGAVRAIGALVRRRPDVRLVITAGQPRNRGSDPLNRTGAAQELARELGLLDRNVFFLTEWIALEDRHRYLGDADLGITLNTGSPESPLAARSRYMDYLWASLPSVLTEGDELADEMATAGAAHLVAPGDVHGAATAIGQLLADPAAMRAARMGCRAMADRYRWASVVEPLVETVETLELSAGSTRDTVAVVCESGAYYAEQVRGTALDTSRHLGDLRRRLGRLA